MNKITAIGLDDQLEDMDVGIEYGVSDEEVLSDDDEDFLFGVDDISSTSSNFESFYEKQVENEIDNKDDEEEQEEDKSNIDNN